MNSGAMDKRNIEVAGGQPRGMTMVGWTLSGLVALLLLVDSLAKLAGAVPPEAAAGIGWPSDRTTMLTLGLSLAMPTVLYLWPRTAVLGAIMVTAYLGGAVATHMRVGNPLLTHTLFGVYLGFFVWGGLWLREPRLRRLTPFRSSLVRSKDDDRDNEEEKR